jgi:acetoacetyl-CoA synthetase
MPNADVIWQPSHEAAAATQMARFRHRFAEAIGTQLVDGHELWRATVRHSELFWELLLRNELGADSRGQTTTSLQCQPGVRWFEDASLNYAGRLLQGPRSAPAVHWATESGEFGTLTRGELEDQVRRAVNTLRACGVRAGDAVAAVATNSPPTLIAMLATAAIGALWSSCSPDFGASALADRLQVVAPKVLLHVDSYRYAGKQVDIRPTIAELRRRLPSVESTIRLDDAGAALLSPSPSDADWRPHAFNHPLFCSFTSGTTGPPKGILHGAGGVLLQQLKEHRLHCDVRPGDVVFYYTTVGWMMWNWLAAALASGATIVLYDGSPTYPSMDALWHLAERFRISLFGTSARYIELMRRSGCRVRDRFDLRSLRTITSTGSPLLASGFDHVYENVRRDVHLASISGGTDIMSCFVLGDPTMPVYRGEIQCPGLAMDVRVLTDDGNPIVNSPGELVCANSFPSMPLGFLGDPGGVRYRATYFERFSGYWHHGDYAEIRDHGGIVVHGRSDGVIKPGGVRIGTAEIYRAIAGVDAIVDSVAVGQVRAGETRIVLCVRLAAGHQLDAELTERLRSTVRSQCSPHHVPSVVIAVPDVPRTLNGKLSEAAARAAIAGHQITNLMALENPEVLEHYRARPELI